MHHIGAGDVGEFEDFLVRQFRFQGLEHAIGHAAALQDQTVRIGEHGAFQRAETVCDRPMGDGGDLVFGQADIAAGLAMLREDELRADGKAGANLAKFAQFRIELAVL